MKYRFIFILFTFFNGSYLNAQIENIMWQKCLGALEGINWTYAVEKTNNGYLYGIHIYNDGPGISNFHGGDDAWIVNMDFNGNVIWERCYGGSSGDGPHKIIRIDNETYYLFNHASSIDGDVHNFQGKDFWMVKINSGGEILWEKNYGGSLNGEIAVDAILMPDKGALMMGRISSSGGDVTEAYGDMDVWLCRIDSVGTILWEKTLGNAWKDNGIKIKQTSRNTILFIGGHEMVGGMIDCPDYGYIFTDVWVVELDLHGNILDQWCYGGLYYDLGCDVVETEDGYIIAASTRSNDRDVSGFHGYPGVDFSDIWIFKIDKSGNILWQRCLGGYSTDTPNYITKTDDNGFIVIGQSSSLDGDVSGNHSMYDYYSDIWVIKLNGNGELDWEHCFGGLGTERFWGTNSVLKIADYNYVIGANTNYLDQDVECDLFPNNIIDYNAWLLEIKDCNYYAPGIPSGISGPDTLCSLADPTSLYSSFSTIWALGYEWKFEPEKAGTISSNDTSAQITWNQQFEGSVNVFARSFNDCGYSAWSEPLMTRVYTCMGVNEHGGMEACEYGSLEIWPNPARGIVDCRWPMVDFRGDFSLVIYDMYGREMMNISVPENESEIQIDVGKLSQGIYLVVVRSESNTIGSSKLAISR